MSGRAIPIPPFVRGFDCLQAVTEPMLREATAAGYGAAGRYLNNLTIAEVALLWQYGFSILLYLEAMTSTVLSVQTGQQYGRLAAGRARALDVAQGVHLVIDLEDPAPGSNETAHVNAMSGPIVAGGWPPALYLGNPPPNLTSAEAFALVTNRYIKGGGRLLEPDHVHVLEPACGWAAIQLEPLEHQVLAGAKVDTWVSKIDYEGRALSVWAPPG
jgi:hypothetical protein